jgi:hypothetical protein
MKSKESDELIPRIISGEGLSISTEGSDVERGRRGRNALEPAMCAEPSTLGVRDPGFGRPRHADRNPSIEQLAGGAAGAIEPHLPELRPIHLDDVHPHALRVPEIRFQERPALLQEGMTLPEISIRMGDVRVGNHELHQ